MTFSRSRLVAACAVTIGVAAPTTGVAISAAASTPGSTPEARTTYSTPATTKCGRTPPSASGSPGFSNVTYTADLPSSYAPGADVLSPGGQPVPFAVVLAALPTFEIDTKSIRVLGGSVPVYLSGASETYASYDILPSAVIPVADAAGPFTPATALHGASPVVTAAAGGSVGFAVANYSIKVEVFTSTDGSGPGRVFESNCSLLSSGPTYALATIPVAGDPVGTPTPTPTVTPTPTPTPTATSVATPTPTPTPAPASAPAVVRVSGSGYGYLGGPIVVAGKRFAGLKAVTVGGKKAKVLGRIGDLVVGVAPAKAPGVYPVVVTTSNGTSPVTAAATYRYARLF